MEILRGERNLLLKKFLYPTLFLSIIVPQPYNIGNIATRPKRSVDYGCECMLMHNYTTMSYRPYLLSILYLFLFYFIILLFYSYSFIAPFRRNLEEQGRSIYVIHHFVRKEFAYPTANQITLSYLMQNDTNKIHCIKIA